MVLTDSLEFRNLFLLDLVPGLIANLGPYLWAYLPDSESWSKKYAQN